MTDAVLLAAVPVLPACLAAVRLIARARRRYVRLVVEPYRGDRTRPQELAAALAALHALVGARGARRVLAGQPSFALEVHLHARTCGGPVAWLGICAPRGLERQVQAALRAGYPNCALRPVQAAPIAAGEMIRLHKRRPAAEPIRRLHEIDPERPPVERLLRAMDAAGGPSVVQFALTPAPGLLIRAKPAQGGPLRGGVEDAPAIPGALSGPYFYADIRVIGHGRAQVAQIAAELRVGGAPNRLVGRRLSPTRRRAYRRRLARGEGNPLPAPLRQSYAAQEIAALWQLPSIGFSSVACRRLATPLAPAPAGIMRVREPAGLVADDHGPVTIDPQLRRQNTAVVGTVEQGKTSFLVASVREDLRRKDCAVIVLDPKGDAADAALSAVPDGRVCTFLDLARPTCGFNPLAVHAPVDAIADYVVAAVRQLFADGEVKGSSDRYLRNALIAVLACDRRASLWDVARLLEVGPAGVALRAQVGHRVAALPEFAEVAAFLVQELPAQLADARSSTTAKLDAPANKLARVLNSSSVKRVLLNDSLTVDFDRLIEQREVLIVRGALGELGPGNVSVLMQLLLGMLDAALARAQDHRGGREPTAVALKIDEAPLVINPSFAQTLALKRSAGLETVACWQTDAQWNPELRDQLDALFAHRALFATASAEDARAAAGLLMAEFSDQLRSGDGPAASLAGPDVRLYLPRHTAILSWSTPSGRERPFIGRTLPLVVDQRRIALIAERQRARGGREVDGDIQPLRLETLLAAEVEMPRPRARLATPQPAEPLPSPAGQAPPLSYAELLGLDAAHRVRWLPIAPAARRPSLDADELALLAWIAAARCVLSSQAHRRLHVGRALTTTQRRLKRLADAGLLARFQVHGGDGGGVPFCCAVTAAGLELLGEARRPPPVLGPQELARLRVDIHVVGWLLALEALIGPALVSVLGPGRPRLVPPRELGRGTDGLELSPGCHARDFLTGDPTSRPRRPVERFAALTPAAVAELCGVGGRAPDDRVDLLLAPEPADPIQTLALLERCDHLIAGWWRVHPRYARLGLPPMVVIVCADADRARALARLADPILVACLARLGEAPERWEYPGRNGVVFAAEPDIHDGQLLGWRVPTLAPQLRQAGTVEPVRGPIVELPAVAPGDRPAPWR